MTSPRLCGLCLAVAAAACAALLTLGMPSSANAVPSSDRQGYIDSTARCTTPDPAVVFGSTETSRVAICETSGGQYEYRGVRVRDGAELIVPASRSGDSGFVADNNGTTYTVTANALVVSGGGQVIREEPMVDFHTPETPQAPAAPPTTTTPPTPWQPPLPAEVGGSGR